MKILNIELLKSCFEEFKESSYYKNTNYILISNYKKSGSDYASYQSNESLELYKLLDYIKDVKEIQDIVMDRSLDDKTIVSKVKDILKKDEFLIDGKKHISYKY